MLDQPQVQFDFLPAGRDQGQQCHVITPNLVTNHAFQPREFPVWDAPPVKVLLGIPGCLKIQSCWLQPQLKQKYGQNANLPEVFGVNMCKNIQITTKMSEYKHPADDCILKILGFPKCSTSQRFSALGSPDPTDSKKHVLRIRNSMFRRHPSRVFQRFRTVFGNRLNRCLYQNTTCWWFQPS